MIGAPPSSPPGVTGLGLEFGVGSLGDCDGTPVSGDAVVGVPAGVSVPVFGESEQAGE